MILLTTIIIIFTYWCYNAFFAATRQIPGPWVSGFSKLWYTWRVSRGNWHMENIALHQRYGKTVRYGPSHCSITSIEDIKRVYWQKDLTKSAWYDAWARPGASGLFSCRESPEHARLRRLYSPLYSMSSVKYYEVAVDECIQVFYEKVKAFAIEEQKFDLAWWMQCLTADITSRITSSERMGFLDTGKDQSDLLGWLHSNLYWGTLIGMVDGLNFLLFRVASFLKSAPPMPMAYLGQFVTRSLQQGKEKRKSRKDHAVDEDTSKDFLSQMLEAQENESSKFSEADVRVGLVQNLIAGSDTTASSLCAILYYIYKNQKVLEHLRAELQSKTTKDARIPFLKAQEMPYLQAVIKESLRLFPAVGLPLERVVPEGGVMLSNCFLSPGTVVGVNPWAIHYSEGIYGSDAGLFKPERWLTTDKIKLETMNQGWIPFGLGARNCIGKNIAMLELDLIVPEFIRNFDISFAEEHQALTSSSCWFVFPDAISVTARLKA